MNPAFSDTLLTDEHVRDYVHTVKYLIGDYWWAAAGLVLIALNMDLLRGFAAGLYWKIGRTYNEKDAVIVNGYYCAIVHIGFFFTEFTVYNRVDRPPNSGYSWLVSNDRLTKLDIWKKRPKHDGEDEVIQTIHSSPKFHKLNKG